MKNKLRPRIAIIAVSSPLEVGAGRAPQKARELEATLKNNNCEVILTTEVSTPDLASSTGRKLAGLFPDLVIFLPVCWFEDYLVLDFLEECKSPILLWALPGMETGSLCGCQQLGSFLKYLEHPFFHVYGEIGDSSVLKRASVYMRASALHSRLRRSKIGVCGSRVNGMTHTSPNEFLLKKSIGSRIIPIPPGKLLFRGDDADVKRIWDVFKKRCGLVKVNDESGLESARMYCALKQVVSEFGLDALTVGCYPDLMGKVCLAASLLSEEGVPMACEGDVHGAVAQLILTLLSGLPTMNADFLEPLDKDSIVFTHCGSSSVTLAEKKEDISLNSVRLMGQGACVLFPSKPGRVTLLNITERENAYQCALLTGEAVETEMVFPGNPARIKFSRPAKDVISWTFDEGMGHHWMIVYGDYAEEIRAWALLANNNLILKEIS